MNKLYVIGMGPGSPDYILPIAYKRVEACKLLIGGMRNLESFPDFQGKKVSLGSDLKAVIETIKKSLPHFQVGVVVSGDTGFYSLLNYLRGHFKDYELEVIPGISSFQYLFAKIKRPWHQSLLLSVHGREVDYLSRVKSGQGVTLLTDHRQSPEQIARVLLQADLKTVEMIVGESLSYEEERIVRGTPEEIIKQAPYNMSVVVIMNE